MIHGDKDKGEAGPSASRSGDVPKRDREAPGDVRTQRRRRRRGRQGARNRGGGRRAKARAEAGRLDRAGAGRVTAG